MSEFDILGFDPQNLKIFNEPEAKKNVGNANIYHTRPADSVSEDGHYRCTIKVIYNPHNLKESILEQQSYAMEDENGWFSVVSKLTNNDTDCPIFKAWKKCRYAKDGDPLKVQSTPKDQGGNGMFDKRFARYCVIQVIEDKNQPELEGKFMFWKLPKSIWDIINVKMNPSVESNKSPIPVMDFLFGRAIELDVIPGPDDKAHPERKARETKYMGELTEDVVSCVNPNGGKLLSDEEQDVLDQYIFAMSKVWKSKNPEERNELKQRINENENTKKLGVIYKKVLEQIKEWCPNLIEELGYREWSDETTARVNKWINNVLNLRDPKEGAVKADTDVLDTVGLASAAAEVTATATEEAAPVASSSDEDLPF